MKTIDKIKVGLAVLSGIFTAAATGQTLPNEFARMAGKAVTCAHAEDLAHPVTELQKAVSDLFKLAEVRLDPEDQANETLQICVDPYLAKRVGFSLLGGYEQERDIFSMNPALNADPIDRALNIRHELEHRAQMLKGININAPANMPLRDRIRVNFMVEAGGRLAPIEFAYRKQQQGHPEFAEHLRKDDYNRDLYNAYAWTMKANPHDKAAARRAVVYAFLAFDELRNSYARNMMDLVKTTRADLAYHPEMPNESILTEQNLRLLTQAEDGNYMTPALLRAIENARIPVFAGP